MRLLLLVGAVWLGWLAAPSSDGPDPGPLDALAWMQGCWVVAEDGEYIEERWSSARGDAMVGTLRWARDGHVWLYELMSIEAEKGDLVFRLRHFSRGLTPWESEAEGALTYPLKSVRENEVVFEDPERDDPRRFVYRRSGDELRVRVEGPEEGSGEEFRFRSAR